MTVAYVSWLGYNDALIVTSLPYSHNTLTIACETDNKIYLFVWARKNFIEQWRQFEHVQCIVEPLCIEVAALPYKLIEFVIIFYHSSELNYLLAISLFLLLEGEKILSILVFSFCKAMNLNNSIKCKVNNVLLMAQCKQCTIYIYWIWSFFTGSQSVLQV